MIKELLHNSILVEASIKALTPIFQSEYTKTPYNSLTDEEKHKLSTHIKQRMDETKKQVNEITTNPQYQSWIYNLLLTKNIKLPEDAQKTKNLLLNYEKIKRSSNFPNDLKNILKFKTFSGLHIIVSEYSKELSSGKKVLDAGNNKVIYDENGVQIIQLDEFDDALFLLNKTGWCVQQRHFFYQYGAPYYLFVEDGQKVALLHINSHQIKDIHDEPLSSEDMSSELYDAIMWLFDNKHVPEEDKYSGEFITILKGDDYKNAIAMWQDKFNDVIRDAGSLDNFFLNASLYDDILCFELQITFEVELDRTQLLVEDIHKLLNSNALYNILARYVDVQDDPIIELNEYGNVYIRVYSTDSDLYSLDDIGLDEFKHSVSYYSGKQDRFDVDDLITDINDYTHDNGWNVQDGVDLNDPERKTYYNKNQMEFKFESKYKQILKSFFIQ